MKRALRHRGPSVFPKQKIELQRVAACPSLEALEHRVLLSGDVLASVVNGNLNIRGDLLSNDLVITPGINAGEVIIASGANTTSINGLPGPITLGGLTRNVDIRMGAGDDIVTMSNLNLPGKVSINGQKGANTLTLNNVQVANNLKILSTTTTTITDATVGKDLQVHLNGPGGDNVALRSVEVQRNTKINTGKGSDILTIDDSTFHGAVRLNTGQGADIIQIEAHGDPLGPPTMFDGSVLISLGGSNDTLQLGVTSQTGNSSVFAGRVRFKGGGGFDTLLNFDASTYAGLSPFRIRNFESNTPITPIPDTTAPTVSFTDPADGAVEVAVNRKIAAAFSEVMDPLTIIAANVTVTSPGPVTVSGTVAYAGRTMTFTPASDLADDTLFTVTITTGANDLAGNPLADDFVWTFTTGDTADILAPTVTSTNPDNLQDNVAINKTVAGTFSEPMDPLTITTANFTVTGPGSTPVTGTVNYDAPSNIATFTPAVNLASATEFTATITGGVTGVKDMAGNPLASNEVWTFTTGTQVLLAPINLGAAGAFAVMATASITSTGPTQINGDVGLNPGTAQGIPTAQVNGTIHIDDQAIIMAQADLLAAYNDAVSRSLASISLPGNMGGRVFTPGLYTNSTSVLISGAGSDNIVTLDAQGDPNAIFIFKMGSTLTTGTGAQVVLAGGAKASNIFWQVGSSATLNTTTIFKGNILAAVTITVNTGSVVEGRLLGGSNSDGSVTINASTITVPVA